MAQKYVFIDRDGVINKDPGGWTESGYVADWEDFIFMPGAIEALVRLRKNGFKTVIISNQQGVGKGYYTKAELDDIDRNMKNAVSKAGGEIAASYYCVHLKEENCPCRKPKNGMFLRAREDLKITDLSDKFFIGDNKTDIMAGASGGVKTILVLTGKSTREMAADWKVKPDYICSSLTEAVEIVIAQRESL